MLRRSILALSHRRSSIRRVQAATQRLIPSSCCRRGFSSVPPGPGSTNKPTGAGRSFPKVLVGSVAIGSCLFAAYSGGYLDDVLGRKQPHSTAPLSVHADNSSADKLPKEDGSFHESLEIKEPAPVHTDEGSQSADFDVRETKDLTESQSDGLHQDNSSNLMPVDVLTQDQVEDSPKISDGIDSKGEQLSNSLTTEETTKDENLGSQLSCEDKANISSSGEQASHGMLEAIEKISTVTDSGAALPGSTMNVDQSEELKSQIEPQDIPNSLPGQSSSLLHTYSLKSEADERDSMLSEDSIKQSSLKEETAGGGFEDIVDTSESKDGKLIVDFLQAIHAAEQRQADLDALVLARLKRVMKDKYEKELKDARARELMYAEEAAMLEKEVKKEKAKAAAALKSLQESAEERLKMALEEKEREAESKLNEVQDLAKAELAASIAREKAAQIERMAEANLNINALCMAFYARSEEARQTHSVHKLALGALALEDALSNGLPVQAELNALGVCLEAIDNDSLLQLAVSSLPEEVRLHGTDSVLNLNQKFNALKGSVRHFSLIPPDGGGILTHSLAHVASSLKVKEADQSGDGIESVLNKVENLLAQGKLVEAADVLEDGVKGSKATEVVSDWLRRVRNRAIAEQALVLLQSYATSMSLN